MILLKLINDIELIKITIIVLKVKIILKFS